VVDSKRFSCGKCVLICRQEFELPIVHGLLVFDAFLHVLRRMLTTCILQAVSDDDAQDMFRTFVFRPLGELVTYGIDGRANSIVQCRTTGAVILGHEVIVERCEVSGLDRAFYLVVELEEVEDGLAGLCSLFPQKFVERALDVILNRAHGAGCIEDEDEVGIIVFHVFLVV